MKHLYYIAIFFMSMVIQTSCSYNFQLDDINEPSKLVMYSYPGGSDTTVVRLSRSIPIQEKGEPTDGMEGADVRLSVNDGEPVSLRWTADSLPGVPARSYYVVHPYKPGDKVHVTARADGLRSVSSRTTVPTAIRLDSVRISPVKGLYGSNTIRFRISFTDDATTTNYYAMRVEAMRTLQEGGRVSVDRGTMSFDVDKEPLLNKLSGLDDVMMMENDFYHNLYYWDDSKIQGKSYTITLDNYLEEDSEYFDGVEDVKVVIKYRVCLYSLSEEFYRYLKSLNDQQNDGLADVELAPRRPLYTNVIHGIGVVGGCRLYYTPWMDNVKVPADIPGGGYGADRY